MMLRSYQIKTLLCALVLLLLFTYPTAAAVPFSGDMIAKWAQNFGIWTPLLLGTLIALENILAPIPGWFLAAASGLLYGFWGGLALVWASAMVGSVIAFYLARRFGRRFLTQQIPKPIMSRLDRISKDNGFTILLTARIVPYTALDLLSYAAGLSNIGFRPYLLATGIGFIPGTAALVATGSQVASLHNLDRVLYLTLGLYLAAIISKGLYTRRKRRTNGE